MPTRRGLDAVAGQRLLEHPAAGLDLAPVDLQRVGAGEERGRRQLPLALLRARAERRSPAARWRPRRRASRAPAAAAARRPRLRPAAGAAGSSLGEVVQRRSAGDLDPVGVDDACPWRCSASTCRARPSWPCGTPGRRRWSPPGPSTRRSGGARTGSRCSTPASRTAAEHHDRARRRDELAGGLADDGAEPAAGALDLGRGARDLVRALGQVEQAEQRPRWPGRRRAPGASRCSLRPSSRSATPQASSATGRT